MSLVVMLKACPLAPHGPSDGIPVKNWEDTNSLETQWTFTFHKFILYTNNVTSSVKIQTNNITVVDTGNSRSKPST